jgi:hypothetical protein
MILGRRRLLLTAIILVAVVALSTYAVAARGPHRTRDAREVAAEEAVRGEDRDASREDGEESEAEEDAGNDFFLDSRAAPGETAISPADLKAAADQAKAIRASTVKELPGLLDPQWHLVGPSNVGGRVTDIAPDPTTPGRVFVAVATAGVWKSDDGGVTLANTWPDDFPQAIGAVTVDQNGTVYVGTGEVNPGGGSLSYGGDGLYRSTDHQRQPDLRRGRRLAVQPWRSPRRLPIDRRWSDLHPGAERRQRLHRRLRPRDGPQQPEQAVRGHVGSPPRVALPLLRGRRLGAVRLDRRR